MCYSSHKSLPNSQKQELKVLPTIHSSLVELVLNLNPQSFSHKSCSTLVSQDHPIVLQKIFIHLTPGIWLLPWKPSKRFASFIFNKLMNCCKPQTVFQIPVDHRPVNKKISFIFITRNNFLISISITDFISAFFWYIFVVLGTL